MDGLRLNRSKPFVSCRLSRSVFFYSSMKLGAYDIWNCGMDSYMPACFYSHRLLSYTVATRTSLGTVYNRTQDGIYYVSALAQVSGRMRASERAQGRAAPPRAHI